MSVDICEHSNATIRKSIYDMTKDDLQDVPDFICPSPPYQTFSYLAGGKHRSKHDFEKTREAVESFNQICSMTKVLQLGLQAQSSFNHCD